jgi:hypothetical protein
MQNHKERNVTMWKIQSLRTSYIKIHYFHFCCMLGKPKVITS